MPTEIKNINLLSLKAYEQDKRRSDQVENSPLKGVIKRFDGAGLPFANPPRPKLDKNGDNYEPLNAFQQAQPDDQNGQWNGGAYGDNKSYGQNAYGDNAYDNAYDNVDNQDEAVVTHSNVNSDSSLVDSNRPQAIAPRPVTIDPKADFKFQAVQNFAQNTKSRVAQRRGMVELPSQGAVQDRANFQSAKNRMLGTSLLRKKGFQDNSPMARMNANVVPKNFARDFFRDKMRAVGFISPEDENKYENLTIKEQLRLREAEAQHAIGNSSKEDQGHFAVTMGRLKAQYSSLQEQQKQHAQLKQQAAQDDLPGFGIEYEKHYVDPASKGDDVIHEAETGKAYVLKSTTVRTYQQEMAQAFNVAQANRDELHLLTPDGIQKGKKELAYFLDPKHDPDERFPDKTERQRIVQQFEQWCNEYNDQVRDIIDQRSTRREVMSKNIFQELGMSLETLGGEKMQLRGQQAMENYLASRKHTFSDKAKNIVATALTGVTLGIALAIPWVRKRVSGQYAVDEMRRAIDDATSMSNPEVLHELRGWNRANARDWVEREYAFSLNDKNEHAHQYKIHDPHGLFAAFGNYTKEELVANLKDQLRLSETAAGGVTDEKYLQEMAEGIFEGLSEGLYNAAEQQLEVRAITQATDDANSWVDLNTMLLRHSCEQAWQLAEEQIDLDASGFGAKERFEARMDSMGRHRESLEQELARYENGVIKSDASVQDEALKTGLDKDIYLDKNDPRWQLVSENLAVATTELEAARKSGQLVHAIIGDRSNPQTIKGLQQQLVDDVFDTGIGTALDQQEARARAEEQLNQVRALREQLEKGRNLLTRANPEKLKLGFEAPRQYDKLATALDELEQRIKLHRDWRIGYFGLQEAIAKASTPAQLDKIEQQAARLTQEIHWKLLDDTQEGGRVDEVVPGLQTHRHWIQDKIKSTRDMMVALDAANAQVDELRDQVRQKPGTLRQIMAQFDLVANSIAADELGHSRQFPDLPDIRDKFLPDVAKLQQRRAELFATSLGVNEPDQLQPETVDKLNALHAVGVLDEYFAEVLKDEVAYRAQKQNQEPGAQHLDAALADLDLTPVAGWMSKELDDLEQLVASPNQEAAPLSANNPFADDISSANPQPSGGVENNSERLAQRQMAIDARIQSVMRFNQRLYPNNPDSRLRVSRDMLRAAGLNNDELRAFTQTHYSAEIKNELMTAIAGSELRGALQNIGIENSETFTPEDLLDAVEDLAGKYQTYFTRIGGGDIKNTVNDLRSLLTNNEPLNDEQILRARALAKTLCTLNPDVDANREVRLAQDQQRISILQQRIAGDFGVDPQQAMQQSAVMREAANKAIVDDNNSAPLAEADQQMNSLKALVTVQQESAALVEGAVLAPLREFGQYLQDDLKDPSKASAEEIRNVMESKDFRKKAKVLGQVAGLFDAAATVRRKKQRFETDSDIYASKLRAMNQLADQLYRFDSKQIKAKGFTWWNRFERQLYEEPPETVLKDLEANGGKKMADDFVEVWKHLSMLNALGQSKEDIEQGLSALANKRNALLSQIQRHRSNQLVAMALLQEFADSGKPLGEFKLDDEAVNNVQQRLQEWGHGGAWQAYIESNPDALAGLSEQVLLQWEAGASSLPADIQAELNEFNNQLAGLTALIRSAAATSQSMKGTVLDGDQINPDNIDKQAKELDEHLLTVNDTSASRALQRTLAQQASWHQHQDWTNAQGQTQGDMSAMPLAGFVNGLKEKLTSIKSDSKYDAKKVQGLQDALTDLAAFDQQVRIIKELVLCGIVPAETSITEMQQLAAKLKSHAKAIKPGFVAQANLKRTKNTDDKNMLDLLANRLEEDLRNYADSQLALVDTYRMNYL